MLVLAPAQVNCRGVCVEALLAGRTILADYADKVARSLVLADCNGVHRLKALDPTNGHGHHFLIAPDAVLSTRLAAAARFSGQASHAQLRRLLPAAGQRHRLTQMLSVLDCLEKAGPPRSGLRFVAETVLYPRQRFGRAIDWKTSTERRQTQRLVNAARHLVQGGYIELLEGRISGSGLKTLRQR